MIRKVSGAPAAGYVGPLLLIVAVVLTALMLLAAVSPTVNLILVAILLTALGVLL